MLYTYLKLDRRKMGTCFIQTIINDSFFTPFIKPLFEIMPKIRYLLKKLNYLWGDKKEKEFTH
jgi:hypothetical protein